MPYVVVSTQGKRDEAGLNAALKIASPYTALIASPKKAKKLLEKAGEMNASQEIIDSVRNPAGLEIGATTPEEIAVALIAELIQFKNSSREVMYEPPSIKNKSDSGSDNGSDNTDAKTVDLPVESSGCCSKSD